MTARAKILVVEDDDDHAELLLRALEDHDIHAEVDRVADGQRALEYLLAVRTGRRPDLVLLDLHLPRVDGFAVLRRLKQDAQLSRVPVVVLTTSSAQADVERARAAHANAYVVKPDDFEALDRMVRDASTFWLTWNRSRG